MILRETAFELYGAVLAGGRSSRMGRDKRLLELDGERLVDRALRVVAEAIGGDARRVTLCGVVAGMAGIPDSEPGLGPLGGLLSGMRFARSSRGPAAGWLVVVPVDMPLLSAATLSGLVAAIPDARRSGARLVSYAEHELPLALEASEATEEAVSRRCRVGAGASRSVRALIGELPSVRLPISDGMRATMLNLNRPEDLESLASRSPS